MRLFHRERVSTKQAIGNTIFRRQLNGRAWLSDPDVFFLREENLRLTAEQKRKLAQVNALLGGVLLTPARPALRPGGPAGASAGAPASCPGGAGPSIRYPFWYIKEIGRAHV